MKVLVTGANGFLGYYLIEKLLNRQFTVIATGRGECRLPFIQHKNFIYQEMDFTDPFQVHDVFEKHSPGVVIHAGAMSKPDDCELDQWEIVRTVLVYGKPQAGKENILTIVKKKLEKGESYNVVDDQVRTPTYVGDLAAGIISVIEKKARGIFHLSGEEVLTPYQMAIRAADYLKLDSSLINKVTAANFSQPAKRPAKTGFTIEKAKRQLDYEPISFEEGLKKTFG